MTNHNPTITSSAATGSFTEDANTTGSTVDHVLTGTMNFTDSDHSDTHTTTTALKTAVWSGGSTLPSGALTRFQGGLSSSIVSDSNGAGKLKWAFSEDDRDFDFLAKNETIVLTYEITLNDNHGGSTKQTVKLTVTGTDDKPVFATTTGATLSEQANHSLSLSPDTAHIALQFTDVDLNNTGHTACVLSASAAGNTSGILPGAFGTAELMSFFDINNVVKTAGSSNGTVNTTFSAPDLAFDYLAAGEQIVITYVVQIDDQKGGVSTQNVTVTVNGTNDAPVVLAFPESAHLTEDHNLSGGNLTAHGDFLFSDLDLSDTHTVSTTVTATRSGGGTVPISDADLAAAMGAVIDPDSTSQLLGDINWNFALSNSAVNFLSEDETLTLNYHITVTDSSGASDTEEVCITVLGINHPVVTKTATVPGGTADHAGEVISYSINVANAGHTTLTGITVTDPSVSNLAPVVSSGFNVGDTNHDSQLSAGETWQYSASYTVTQNDINTLGNGSGVINNTVTVNSAQALPVSASSSVVVESGSSVDLVKTADVSSVDTAGDVINYTINVTNTGNGALTNPLVGDSQVNIVTPVLDFDSQVLGPPLVGQVLNGDYNAGDTNQNGVQDPGETFQYQIVGDENNNGVQDPGEMFVTTNIGDTNQNGVNDPGETFQYYNAGDANHNGVEDSGETFQFNVDHTVAGVDANHDGLNDGDTNHDGNLDVGETWQYALSYTVTQADIDNGGVVNLALTHDNTASVTTDQGVTDDGSVSVLVVQNPDVTLVKSASVADGTADAAGDVINYTFNATNDGNMTLTGADVTDPSVSDLAPVLGGGFNVGDSNQDGKVDIGETWQYTASHTITQDEIDAGGTIDNTASATTDQNASDTDSASVTIVQNPHVVLDKTASVPGGTADTVGEVISYAITVHNDGNVSLTNPAVTDPAVTDLAAVTSAGFNTGDTDHDGKVDVGETWNYSASHTVTQADIDAGGTIDNTASVTTDQGASSNDSASVTVEHDAAMTLIKAALGYHDANSNSVADEGDTIDFSFMVNNTGNATLHQIDVSDVVDVSVTGTQIASLAPGASDSSSWSGTYVITAADVSAGYHDNDAVATALETSASSGTVHVVLAGLPLLV